MFDRRVEIAVSILAASAVMLEFDCQLPEAAERLRPLELPRKPTTFSLELASSLKLTVRVLVVLSKFKPR